LTHFGVIIVFLALAGCFNAVLLPESQKKRRVSSNVPAASFGRQEVPSIGRG